MITEKLTIVNKAHIKLWPVIWVNAFERPDAYTYV